MRKKIVYKLILGKRFYIGSSVNFSKRKNKHLNDLRNKKHANNYIQNVWNSGKSNIQYEILFESTENINIQEVEQKFLDIYYGTENCMNLCPNVGGGAVARDPKEASRKAMNTMIENGYYDSMRGVPKSEEAKKTMSISAKKRVARDPSKHAEIIKAGQKKRWENHNKDFYLKHETSNEILGPFKYIIEVQNLGIMNRLAMGKLYRGKKKKCNGYTLHFFEDSDIIDDYSEKSS